MVVALCFAGGMMAQNVEHSHRLVAGGKKKADGVKAQVVRTTLVVPVPSQTEIAEPAADSRQPLAETVAPVTEPIEETETPGSWVEAPQAVEPPAPKEEPKPEPEPEPKPVVEPEVPQVEVTQVPPAPKEEPKPELEPEPEPEPEVESEAPQVEVMQEPPAPKEEPNPEPEPEPEPEPVVEPEEPQVEVTPEPEPEPEPEPVVEQVTPQAEPEAPAPAIQEKPVVKEESAAARTAHSMTHGQGGRIVYSVKQIIGSSDEDSTQCPFTIRQNPAADNIIIQFRSNIHGFAYRISPAPERMAESGTFVGLVARITGLPEGEYQLHLTDNSTLKNYLFVVKKEYQEPEGVEN